MPSSYNHSLGLELAAVLKSRSGFVVQWHCLVLRGGGCSRPAMMLLKSCALRIGTEIGWKPEIHMTHINSAMIGASNYCCLRNHSKVAGET